MLWYGLGRPVITLKIGDGSVFVLFGWCVVFGIIMRWEEREPFQSDVDTTRGNSTAASLFGGPKVSSTKDLLNGQTCQGILCASTWSPHLRPVATISSSRLQLALSWGYAFDQDGSLFLLVSQPRFNWPGMQHILPGQSNAIGGRHHTRCGKFPLAVQQHHFAFADPTPGGQGLVFVLCVPSCPA